MVILPIGVVLLVVTLIAGGKVAVIEILLILMVGALSYFMCSLADQHFAQMVLMVTALLCLQIFAGAALPLIENVGSLLAK